VFHKIPHFILSCLLLAHIYRVFHDLRTLLQEVIS